jgi:hypothetical protein
MHLEPLSDRKKNAREMEARGKKNRIGKKQRSVCRNSLSGSKDWLFLFYK